MTIGLYAAMALRRHIQMILALFLTVALLGLPAFVPSLHAPTHSAALEDARHAVLADVEASEHGHSHDDGEPYESKPGHAHGHDPADHSHQVAFMVHKADETLLDLDGIQFAIVQDLIKSGIVFGFERPPKTSL